MVNVNLITCKNNNAGFFSDFLHRILPSIIYSYDNNCDFHVEWRNPYYQNRKENLFDKYFNHKGKCKTYNEILSLRNCPYKTYFKQDWNNEQEDLLRFASLVIEETQLINTNFFNNIKLPFDINKKVLGVQQRKTDHHEHVGIKPDQEIIDLCKNEFVINAYDEIFLVTDNINTLELFKKEFGLILKYNNVLRSSSDSPIHKGQFDKYKERLADDVVRDAYCLSKTDYKIICNSNVSTFSLLLDYNQQKYKHVDQSWKKKKH